MARIVIVDDDVAMDILLQRLRYCSHDVERHGSLEDALAHMEALVAADLVILDIIMPWPEGKTKSALAGTGTAGMEVLREIRTNNTTVPVIVYSAIQDSSIIDALDSDSHVSFFSKWNGPSLKDLVAAIHGVLKLPLNTPPPQTFIVHGRNESAKLALKNYLQNTLKLPEPIILHEQPSMGRTVMEKFEDYAAQSSVAFVILTPDDTGAALTESNDSKRRARQNVIYELGYFHGHFGRHSGRVILLHQGDLDLPSDLTGIVYIDIAAGIEFAGEEIRKELTNVIKSNI